MKPIQLEMTAFGSYAEKTVVDFRKLERGLFLITGDTGAGKTTIFDALMFALFGEASGEKKKGAGSFRTFDMMHCDYVDKTVDTLIFLKFEHLGKKHMVERRFHFRKSRSTGEFTKTTPSASFWEEGKEVITQTDRVTKRIVEILGLNAEQFRKTTMLAQGEFRRFLEADSEEKNQILSELFDNSDCVFFQNLLYGAKRILEEKRSKEYKKIQSALEMFQIPEDLPEGESLVFTFGHRELENALWALVKKEEEQKEELLQQERLIEKEEERVYKAIGAAKGQNDLFFELREKERLFRELDAEKRNKEEEEQEWNRIKALFHFVLREEKYWMEKKEEYDKAYKDVEKLREEMEKKEKEVCEKEIELEKKETDAHEVEALAREIEKITETLPEYDRHKKKKEEWREVKQSEEKTKEKVIRIQGQIEEMEQNCRILEQERQELADVLEERGHLERQLENATKNAALFSGKNGVREMVEDVLEKEKSLLDQRVCLWKITKEAEQKSEKYHLLYQSFLRDQADVLATELKKEVEEKKEAVCPVCKTKVFIDTFSGAERSMAVLPEKGQVDRAKKAFEKKDREREEKEKEVMVLKTEIDHQKRSVLEKIAVVIPDCNTFETLSDGAYLEHLAGMFEEQKKEAQKRFKEAVVKGERLADVLEKIERLRKGLPEKQKAMQELLDTEQLYRRNREKLELLLAETGKGLMYPDKETAKRILDEKKKKKQYLEKERDRVRAEFEIIKKDYHALDGKRKGEEMKLPEKEQDFLRAEKEFGKMLARYGLSDREEVHLILAPLKGVDGERFIEKKLGEIRAYKMKLETTKERIFDLEQKTKGMEIIDTALLEQEHTELRSRRELLKQQSDQCKARYSNYKQTASRVSQAKEALKQTESAWERLLVLSDLAVGTNAEGGKLSFDRYVMGYVFKDILRMANRRLEIMSGGRYELFHEMFTEKKNVRAGLEISVLDMTTGKSRNSATLSGGEAFLVSLSLALGLSDVVRSHAGGKQLETLFIDEGFGSLDSDALDKALTVLDQLSVGSRMVGVISHVSKLEESIPQQICVKRTEKGSVLSVRG